MSDEERIEAAAKSLWEDDAPHPPWEEGHPRERGDYLMMARRMLRAADKVEREPMEEADRYAKYLICKERGHEGSGLTLTSMPPWSVCKFCGTHFRYSEPALIEQNVPQEPS